MLDKFLEWSKFIKPEIDDVLQLMSAKLSSEPMILISNLQEIEAWNARMGEILAEANSWLDQYSLTAMPDKENKSEMERKLILNKETAPIRVLRDTVEHLCDSIKQRLILGESILSYYKQFVEHKKHETVY